MNIDTNLMLTIAAGILLAVLIMGATRAAYYFIFGGSYSRAQENFESSISSNKA